MIESMALVRLLQLASPALPVGAYSYSQGLEWQVHVSAVHDEATAKAWIGNVLDDVIACGEAPVLAQLLRAIALDDCAAFVHWNQWFRASRESSELRAETLQMGGSLAKLALTMQWTDDARKGWYDDCQPIAFPAAFALAAHACGVPHEPTLLAYMFAWLENQVLAAIKLVPLGQVGGQRILHALGERLPGVASRAMTLPAGDIASFAPGLALASARHETQHTRLFRS